MRTYWQVFVISIKDALIHVSSKIHRCSRTKMSNKGAPLALPCFSKLFSNSQHTIWRFFLCVTYTWTLKLWIKSLYAHLHVNRMLKNGITPSFWSAHRLEKKGCCNVAISYRPFWTSLRFQTSATVRHFSVFGILDFLANILGVGIALIFTETFCLAPKVENFSLFDKKCILD